MLFYDRRNDPKNRKQIVVLARSIDHGRTFNNYAWTDEPFEAGGLFFGDYSGIAAFGGRVYGVWTEKPATPTAEGRANTNKEEVTQSKPSVKGTVVKLGTADFTNTP